MSVWVLFTDKELCPEERKKYVQEFVVCLGLGWQTPGPLQCSLFLSLPPCLGAFWPKGPKLLWRRTSYAPFC